MLRSLAGVSGRDLAKQVGVSQPTVVRIERAENAPSMPIVLAWLDATGAPAEAHERVIALTEAIHLQTVRWPTLLAGRNQLQDEVRERELESVLVQNFQPTVIAGLLQTTAYTRALLPLTDITGRLDHEATLAGRHQRQQVLYEPGRRFQFLIAESVLSWAPGEDVLAGQLDRLLQLSDLPAVDIAVLPTAARVATPWHNFVIHHVADSDASYVTTELIHGTQRLSDLGEVEMYRDLWDRLWAASSTAENAREIIRGMHAHR